MEGERPQGAPSALKDGPSAGRCPEGEGRVWSCSLLTAGTSDGGTFEILAITDEQTRECPAILVEPIISSQEVFDRLFDLVVLRGAPECIRSDDWPEALAQVIDDGLRRTGVETRLVKGDSLKSDSGGSFVRSLREALIGGTTFTTLPEAKEAIEGWRNLHNATVLRHPTLAEEPSQSLQVEDTAGDNPDAVWTLYSGDSPADEADGGQSVPQHESPGVQLELHWAPGLPGSLPHESEARQSLQSLGSVAAKAGDGQSIPQHESPGVQLELHWAPGLPGSLRHESEARQSLPEYESPGGQLEPNGAPGLVSSLGGQTIRQQDSPASELEPYVAPSVVNSLDGQIIRQHESHGSELEPHVAPGLASSVRRGSGASRTGRSAWKLPEAAIHTGQALLLFRPSSSQRRTMTPGRRVRYAAVRMSEWVGIATVSLLIIVVLLTLAAPNFGWRVDTVESGSMEPDLGVGSVVVTRPVDNDEIGVGDLITFRSPTSGDTTSHRVLAVEDGPSFLIEGIANEGADPFVVPAYQVDGRVCLHVPFVGYVLQRLTTPTGLLLLFLFGFAIAVSEIGSIFELRRKEPAPASPGAI